MKYIYPKEVNMDNISVIEKKDKFIIRNTNLLNIFGIIINIQDCIISKQYKNFKVVLSHNSLEKYDTYLDNIIPNYEKIIKRDSENQDYLLLGFSDKNDEYFSDKNKQGKCLESIVSILEVSNMSYNAVKVFKYSINI